MTQQRQTLKVLLATAMLLCGAFTGLLLATNARILEQPTGRPLAVGTADDDCAQLLLRVAERSHKLADARQSWLNLCLT